MGDLSIIKNLINKSRCGPAIINDYNKIKNAWNQLADVTLRDEKWY
jgi:hypothetical protein